MGYQQGDIHFVIALETLLKISDRKELIKEAKKLENEVASSGRPSFAFRLAYELTNKNIKTPKLENYFINLKSAYYIFKYAQDIKYANIEKLQSAIMNCNNVYYIVRFACEISKANKSEMEDKIAALNSAKAVYLYMKYANSYDVEKFKNIIFKSKKPRYLFELAKNISNKEELDLIQKLIISSSSNMYVRLFAAHIPGADINQLEDRIIRTKNVNEMKRFLKMVKSPKLTKLSILF